MSAVNAPFGLRPAFHPSGLERARGLAGGIASGYASNILKGQAVKYTGTSGNIVPVTGTEAFSGVFAGVEWTDTTGRRRVSNYWPANTAYVAGSCVAYYYDDPQIVYEVQADGSIPATAIGNEANLTTANLAAGSTATGLSAATMSSTLTGNGVQGQLRIVDFSLDPANAPGDAFTVVRVVIANTQFVAPTTALA